MPHDEKDEIFENLHERDDHDCPETYNGEPSYFFDSWGRLWEALEQPYYGPLCEAFGPTGIARRTDAKTLYEVEKNETAYAAAKRQGLIDNSLGENWPHLNLSELPMDVELKGGRTEEPKVPPKVGTGKSQEYFDNALRLLNEFASEFKKDREKIIALNNIKWYVAALKVECDELRGAVSSLETYLKRD